MSSPTKPRVETPLGFLWLARRKTCRDLTSNTPGFPRLMLIRVTSSYRQHLEKILRPANEQQLEDMHLYADHHDRDLIFFFLKFPPLSILHHSILVFSQVNIYISYNPLRKRDEGEKNNLFRLTRLLATIYIFYFVENRAIRKSNSSSNEEKIRSLKLPRYPR